MRNAVTYLLTYYNFEIVISISLSNERTACNWYWSLS